MFLESKCLHFALQDLADHRDVLSSDLFSNYSRSSTSCINLLKHPLVNKMTRSFRSVCKKDLDKFLNDL